MPINEPTYQAIPAKSYSFGRAITGRIVCLRLIMSRFSSGSRDLHKAAIYLLLGSLMISLALAVAINLPQTPYHMRELFSGRELLVSLPLFAIFLIWMTGMPNIMARITIICPMLHLAQPLLFLLLAVPGWWLLKLSVSTESLFSLLGTPVLGWPGDWELFSRYLALSAPFLLSLFYWNLLLEGSAWISREFAVGQVLGAVLLGLPLLALSKYIVVDRASTDTLLKFSAQGPTWYVGGALALVMALTTLNGVLLAWLRLWHWNHRLIVAILTPVLLLSTWWLLTLGLNNKGLHFLLTPSLQHQAGHMELFVRWSLLYGASVGLIAFAHLIPFRLRGSSAHQKASLSSKNLHTARIGTGSNLMNATAEH